MLVPYFALRYLRRRRMAWLALAAVALTVWVSVLVLGVMEGWVSFTRVQVRASESDISLRSSEGILASRAVDTILTKHPSVVAAAPFIATPAPMVSEDRSGSKRMIPIHAQGVDWQADRAINRLNDAWLHPRPGLELSAPPLEADERGTGFITQDCRAWLPLAGLETLGGLAGLPVPLPPRASRFRAGLIVGRELMYEQGGRLRMGSPVAITLPDQKGGRLGSVRLEISDTVGTGVLEIDRYAAIMPLASAQRLTDQDDRRHRNGGPKVDGYRMRVSPDADLEQVRSELLSDSDLVSAVQGSRARIDLWHEIRGNAVRLLEINLRTLRIVMIVLQALCIFTVAAVFSTLVAEKRHDIGVLIGIGVHPWRVIAIFLLASTLACVGGGLLGWGAGWGALALINPLSEWTGWTLFPQQVFYTSEAPIHFDWRTPASFIALQAGIGLVSALIPAIRAGLINPVDTIREAG
ncbi:MAG: hypothetical protein PF961_00380 [Planctomycetota bacterium]|jgi:ABC-type lipoprotein release transport system permease subunit|nr:hypothetical protein [Planctomycetota bacterium]